MHYNNFQKRASVVKLDSIIYVIKLDLWIHDFYGRRREIMMANKQPLDMNIY